MKNNLPIYFSVALCFFCACSGGSSTSSTDPTTSGSASDGDYCNSPGLAELTVTVENTETKEVLATYNITKDFAEEININPAVDSAFATLPADTKRVQKTESLGSLSKTYLGLESDHNDTIEETASNVDTSQPYYFSFANNNVGDEITYFFCPYDSGVACLPTCFSASVPFLISTSSTPPAS
ncbi:MAG: hypothetical protein ACD_62C00531G0002 [uncultured bacterium]|nr:MAG: hypothetical protein ACD_62C00531G0002 [uncultured bacterium]